MEQFEQKMADIQQQFLHKLERSEQKFLEKLAAAELRNERQLADRDQRHSEEMNASEERRKREVNALQERIRVLQGQHESELLREQQEKYQIEQSVKQQIGSQRDALAEQQRQAVLAREELEMLRKGVEQDRRALQSELARV